MLWLPIVTWAPGITAPLGSVTVPKIVATSVCANAYAGSKPNNKTKHKHALELKDAQRCRQAKVKSASSVRSIGRIAQAELSSPFKENSSSIFLTTKGSSHDQISSFTPYCVTREFTRMADAPPAEGVSKRLRIKKAP